MCKLNVCIESMFYQHFQSLTSPPDTPGLLLPSRQPSPATLPVTPAPSLAARILGPAGHTRPQSGL